MLCFYIRIHKVFLCGFPHSDIHGSKDICSSPWLFAAYHVLPRLSVPRHPPCALSSLTFFTMYSVTLLLVCLFVSWFDIFMSHLGCLNIFCLFDILICSFQGTALRVFYSATYSDCLTSHQVVGSFSCYLIAGQAAVRAFYYDTYLYKHTF